MSKEETPSHTWVVLASEITYSHQLEPTLSQGEAPSPFELSLLMGMMAHPRSSFTTEPLTSFVRMEWSQDHMI